MQLLFMVAAVNLKERLPFVILGMVLLISWYFHVYPQIASMIALFMGIFIQCVATVDV